MVRRSRRDLGEAKAQPAAATRPANVEVQAPWKGRHNYTLNSATVLLDVYRLLTLVLADREIACIGGDEGGELAGLRDQFVEDELVHLLISTAVMNRSQDDHWMGPRKDPNELSFKPVDHICGTLWADMSQDSPKEKPLTFREACNKIIHAEHITAEMESIEDGAFDVLPPSVMLRGTFGEKAWQAQVVIPEYVRATKMNFRY